MAGAHDEASDTSRWECDDRVLSRAGPGFIVLLGTESATPVVLRGSGVELWAAFERPLSVRELAVRLSTTFHADYDRVRSDIASVVDRLVATGALRPVP